MTALEFFVAWTKPAYPPTAGEEFFANWIEINGYGPEFAVMAKAMKRHLKKKGKKAA